MALAVKEPLLLGLQPGIISYINNFLVAGPPPNLMWCHYSLISCQWADLLGICNGLLHLETAGTVTVLNNWIQVNYHYRLWSHWVCLHKKSYFSWPGGQHMCGSYAALSSLVHKITRLKTLWNGLFLVSYMYTTIII